MAAPDLVESHDEDGFTPLHLAVIAGNMPLVTFLLANKADVNAVDNEKHTVVHWATGKCTYASYMLRVVHQIYEKLFSAVSCQRSIYVEGWRGCILCSALATVISIRWTLAKRLRLR
jgi:uncharacterized membrane protein YkvI